MWIIMAEGASRGSFLGGKLLVPMGKIERCQ